MKRFTALGVAAAILSGSTALAQSKTPLDDERRYGYLELEQLEYQWGDDEDTRQWEAQGWYGSDYEKIWFKTEGEKLRRGGTEEASVQLLYSHMVNPFFDWQAGVRYDFEPDPETAYAVLGLQGLAPYMFEIDTAVFVSEEGDVTARAEAEYELLFTQRLIGKPSFEINGSAQDVDELGLADGFNDVAVGFRLRYEFVRELAPYVGVEWHRLLGATADLAEDAGADTEETRWVAGVRIWY